MAAVRTFSFPVLDRMDNNLLKLHSYNPFLAYENGDEFVRPFREAAEGKLARPFILVVEGSIPNENNKNEGYWVSFGTDPLTGQM